MSDDNKVVPFPAHKVRKPKGEGSATPPTNGQDPAVPSTKRTTLVLSLIGTVFVATLVMSRLSLNSTSLDRNIASDSATEPRRDLEEDILLARKIARESLREPASSGREPSAEEVFAHGELAGRYKVNFGPKGNVIGVDFIAQPGVEPRALSDRKGFVDRNRELLGLKYQDIEKVDPFRDKDYKYEIYNLKQDGRVNTRVHFKLKPPEDLVSMKVESVGP